MRDALSGVEQDVWPTPISTRCGAALDGPEPVLPPSALAAYAALRAGCPYVDFTPSTGARLPALDTLAR